ncbi:DnaJ domain-containing protein [Candidatus Micrarchaeota archaeon]|nr:DnaJ domain-containing protein [Candidatus Micrarchaeota archaeon]
METSGIVRIGNLDNFLLLFYFQETDHYDKTRLLRNTEKFKEISEAYAVLSDQQKRSQYDQYGHAGFDQRYSQEDIFRGANFNDFEEVFRNAGFGTDFDPFSSFFGGGFGGRGSRSGRQMQYGSDLETGIEISLDEAATGITKELSYSHNKPCSECKGSGSAPGTTRKICQQCNGKGQVQQARRMGPMQFYTVSACNKCRGLGSTIEKPCKKCNGSGDLYVNVSVRKHDLFERDGDDLWMDLFVPYSQLVLGGTVEVKTLFGKAELHIPAGTQSHTVFRLRGEGLPNVRRGGKGDQMVRVIVEIPKKLSKTQKQLLEQLGKDGKEDEQNKKDKLFGVL